MKKANIAVFGTGSDVGKSIVAAGICRYLADKGQKVAPFKAQNMSNNSGITPEGLEMGRAQIVQAQAARIPPHVQMNPILLKPFGDKQSQVVLNGIVHGNHTAMEYHTHKAFYFEQACQAFDALSARYDRIVLEGAGSCAEVNLMDTDIVNFPMAHYAKAQVILTADIHRGGVFAQIVGTLACLPPLYRDMVKGIIINRFRGDIDLFKTGVEWIQHKTGKAVLGVLPWYSHFKIDAEDSVEIEKINNIKVLNKNTPAIAILRLPHIANFTDFHALARTDRLQTVFIDSSDELGRFAAIIIPGTKNTRKDLAWVMNRFEKPLKSYIQSGGHILGICGGYQMLGRTVEDPDGLEGMPGLTRGLGLLPVHTILQSPKTTTLSEFEWNGAHGRGYEIHMGATRLTSGTPFINIHSRNGAVVCETDGCMADSGQVAGTYIHGFFDSGAIIGKWFSMIGLNPMPDIETDSAAQKDKDYDRLKNHMEKYLNMDEIA
ncbi:MAG: cobyric acid synthase [Desulfotignum sp.]|nr:cobyric acid synthase [Desulfotignum sp.]MCF8125984.1 cobyric acid synthase [Desulfotignum sp.]